MNGSWERYEHPEKGETLSLMMGNVAILSLHNVLTEGHMPISRFMHMMANEDVSYFLLAKVARLEQELATAVRLLAEKLPRG